MPKIQKTVGQAVANGNLIVELWPDQANANGEIPQTSAVDLVDNHRISRRGATLGYVSGPPSASWQIALQGNYAYVADYSTGMVAVDISNTNSPIALATFNPGVTRSTSVAVKGNYVFFVNGNNGLYVLDVSTPSSPSQVYFSQPPGRFVLESALSNNYLYLVAEVGTGLNIIDISTPTSPSQVGNFPIPGQTQGIAVSGNYAYLANTGSGFYIINVSNPASPTQVANLATPGGAYGVAVSGNYAYVAAQGSGLHIINISNPASPSIVATYNTPGSAQKVAIQGNYAVVADNTGLQIIDVSNPTSPFLTGSSTKACISATVSGNYVYAGCGGLQIFKTLPAPVLGTKQLTVSEGQTVTLTTSNFSATDPDAGASALTYTISNLAGGGRFELSSNPGIAITQFTQQQVNSGAVRFVDDGNEVAPSFMVSVSDGLMFTKPTSATINYTPVNDAPTLSSTTTTALAFTEKGAAQVVNPTLVVSDVDNANLASATVTITGYVSGQDVLTLPTNPQNGISASFNTSTGVLTLTGSSSIANYQAALRTVTYQNTSDNPSTAARSISIVVNDGIANSNAVSRSVTITAVNDAPTLSSTTTTALAFTENGVAQVVDPTLIVSDVDNANLASATVTITGYISGQDILAFMNTATITGSFDTSTGVLTLTGIDSVANYQAALQSITFESSDATYSSRTISFEVNDGASSSNVITRLVDLVPLNNLLSGSETNLLCLNEENSKSLFSQLSIVGGNALTLENATVTVSNPVSAEDTLEITDLSNGITGNYDSNTGVLTLTGPATASEFEATLQTVKYKNSNGNTDSSTKTFTVAVNYAGLSSNTLQAQIDLITVNDAPVVINPVEDFNVTVNEPFATVLNSNTFSQPVSELSLSVSENDGALTSLSFDPATRTLNGSLATVGENRFSFFASDRCNQSAASDFTVGVLAAPVASPITAPITDSNIVPTSPAQDNTGPIVGGVVGGIAALGVIGGVIGGLLYRRNKQKKEDAAATKAAADALTTFDVDAATNENAIYEKKKTSWYNSIYESFRRLTSRKLTVEPAALPVPTKETETELVEKSISSHESEISKSSAKSASSSAKSYASSHKSGSHAETSSAGSEESEEESAESSVSSSASSYTP